jgi:hypothetical protein
MTAAELIAAGKTAVEAELARIEGDIQAAKTKALAESSAVAAALQKHLDTHSAEVTIATALLERASSVVVPVVAEVIGNTVPIATLTMSVGMFSKAGTWLNKQGWKGGALVGIVLVVGHYLIGKVF